MNIQAIQDPLWPEFALLWKELGAMNPPVVLSGGYGLFLKQLFLTRHPEVATAVPLERWRVEPRSTRDLDFLLDVQLIAQAEKQKEIRGALNAHGYTPLTPLWQFKKDLASGQEIHVDLLAPATEADGVENDGVRRKRRPSLGQKGVHAHTTFDAIGCEMHPFGFEWEGVSLVVPNPVSWCVMKLCATRDRWQRAQNAESEVAERAEQRGQALKHAGDVCRLAAMMTREERANTPKITEALSEETAFQDAAEIAQKFFVGAGAIMTREKTIMQAWDGADFQTVQGVLSTWLLVE